MTSKQITHSIKTGRLQLMGWERLSFYQHVIWLAGAGAASGLYALNSIYLADATYRTGSLPIFLLAAAVILFLLAAAQFVNLYRSLKLTLISTNLTWPVAKKMLLGLASRQRWSIRNNRKTFIRMRTHPSHWFDLRGEQISIFFNRGNIWAVSICDPDGLITIVTQDRANIQLLSRELSGNRRLASTKGTAKS